MTHLTSSSALALAQYKTELNKYQNENDPKKSQTVVLTASTQKADTEQPLQRSKSGPATKKKGFGSIFRSPLAKSLVEGKRKPAAKRPSIFLRLLEKTSTVRRPLERSITSDQLNLINDVSVPEAVLRRHGPRKSTGIDFTSSRGRQPLLVSYMMKHAGSMSKEGEIFAKILVNPL